MSNMVQIGIIAGVIVIALLTIGMILSRLYRRASKEISFVRTGFGGQKVIINGGALVLPVLHEVIPVNMNTLRLEVKRSAEQALITADRMRVDVTAEFYVRAKPSADAIAASAQTLGLKTMNPSQLKELVEGKFVDALRAVAAEMGMEELHEQRVNFVQKVQQVVSEDLAKNGLELESVSLTGLDQTNIEHFNPQNAFDAEGMTRLTETIETRRKTRNDIEKENQVAIRMKDLEAERQMLEIAREEEYARLAQEREVEVRKASQEAEIARERAAKRREAEEADIEASREVDTTKLMAERSVEEERVQKDRAIETAEIERRKTVELAEQDRAIAIAEKSKAQSEAQAEADKARGVAVKEEEGVQTVRLVEQAERTKQVELVQARQAAEKQAISVTVAAEAEKQAADDRADAARILAEGEAEKERIVAKGAADSTIMRAQAAERRYQVDAEGKRLTNQAANVLSEEQIAMQIRLALIEHLPKIIAESVRPMEQIDGIKIYQVDGLTGANGAANGHENGAAGAVGLPDQLVGSALRYRAQAPLVDALLKEVGLQGGDVADLAQALADSAATTEKPTGGHTK